MEEKEVIRKLLGVELVGRCAGTVGVDGWKVAGWRRMCIVDEWRTNNNEVGKPADGVLLLYLEAEANKTLVVRLQAHSSFMFGEVDIEENETVSLSFFGDLRGDIFSTGVHDAFRSFLRFVSGESLIREGCIEMSITGLRNRCGDQRELAESLKSLLARKDLDFLTFKTEIPGLLITQNKLRKTVCRIAMKWLGGADAEDLFRVIWDYSCSSADPQALLKMTQALASVFQGKKKLWSIIPRGSPLKLDFSERPCRVTFYTLRLPTPAGVERLRDPENLVGFLKDQYSGTPLEGRIGGVLELVREVAKKFPVSLILRETGLTLTVLVCGGFPVLQVDVEGEKKNIAIKSPTATQGGELWRVKSCLIKQAREVIETAKRVLGEGKWE